MDVVRHQEEFLAASCARFRMSWDPQADIGNAVTIHIGGQRDFADAGEAEVDGGIDVAGVDDRDACRRRCGVPKLNWNTSVCQVPRSIDAVAVEIADDREASERVSAVVMTATPESPV